MGNLKIAFGTIIFNGNNTFEESLKTIYPYASQILIAEGPVKFWQDKGFTTSIDGTNEMLDSFPDPDNKMKIVHGQYSEKLEQTNAYMQYINDDIDYLWNLDSDQVFKPEDIEAIIGILEKSNKTYTLVKVSSITFFGGFDRYITGFEEAAGFPALYRVYPGSRWLKHRYPTMKHKQKPLKEKVLKAQFLTNKGIRLYHYSAVFALHVSQKIKYYTELIGNGIIIDNYYTDVWRKWIYGNRAMKKAIEKHYKGVHEFKPHKRGDSYTKRFTGEHPKLIKENMEKLRNKFHKQLKKYG